MLGTKHEVLGWKFLKNALDASMVRSMLTATVFVVVVLAAERTSAYTVEREATVQLLPNDLISEVRERDAAPKAIITPKQVIENQVSKTWKSIVKQVLDDTNSSIKQKRTLPDVGGIFLLIKLLLLFNSGLGHAPPSGVPDIHSVGSMVPGAVPGAGGVQSMVSGAGVSGAQGMLTQSTGGGLPGSIIPGDVGSPPVPSTGMVNSLPTGGIGSVNPTENVMGSAMSPATGAGMVPSMGSAMVPNMGPAMVPNMSPPGPSYGVL
uniref:Uncharacterized protein n=1 Tax=Anopheles culicifacies TaxID=139723 RepID=A0A182MB00_9DIPT